MGSVGVGRVGFDSFEGFGRGRYSFWVGFALNRSSCFSVYFEVLRVGICIVVVGFGLVFCAFFLVFVFFEVFFFVR